MRETDLTYFQKLSLSKKKNLNIAESCCSALFQCKHSKTDIKNPKALITQEFLNLKEG